MLIFEMDGRSVRILVRHRVETHSIHFHMRIFPFGLRQNPPLRAGPHRHSTHNRYVFMNETMDRETSNESVDELRQRLNHMKQMMADRKRAGELEDSRRADSLCVIDGSFLSVVFGVALIVIITVSIYAFYNLYHAILKKFPSHHEEL